jgi:hypothetical protein
VSAPTVLPVEEATELDVPAAHRGPGELPPPPIVITTHGSPPVQEPAADTDLSAGNGSGSQAAASAALTAAVPGLALVAELNVATAVPGTARRLFVRYASPLRTTPLPAAPADELRLVAAPAPVRPRASLGILWGAALLAALFVGPIEVAVLVAPVAFFAAASGLRFGRPIGADQTKKSPLVAVRPRLCLAAAVGAIPLVALVGPLAAVLLVVALGALVACLASRGGYGRGPVLAIALAPALAAGSLVLARRESLTLSIVLVAATGLYDIAACLMGTGRDGGRPALIAGLATMGMFGFVVSAIANPPLGGPWPWIVCGLIGLLAAAAVRVVSRLVVPGRAPAMRRLDSLALAGPVWVVLVLVAFHS